MILQKYILLGGYLINKLKNILKQELDNLLDSLFSRHDGFYCTNEDKHKEEYVHYICAYRVELKDKSYEYTYVFRCGS